MSDLVRYLREPLMRPGTSVLRTLSRAFYFSVLYEIYLMSDTIEVFKLRGNTSPFATVTFKVTPGTGIDEDGNPLVRFIDHTGDGDHGELPVGGLVYAWTECPDPFRTSRYWARRIYRRCLASGYFVTK